ncbi:prepilin-type N-terminal cleavage/methylation domain-containing protein [Armatimonas rosea]|uniref:Prepilin-type N-terminal cleavage/methylation domain-containing protein/prepilin-type processing-associated H-X9-DG protein n=1 Tax=Armatimonas rosea TaxID=685828 RepID=A0A7W9SRD8_ARMRO|nr:prepilin-type N-terminal cleavage/methylation domain-containing protein [Armatimonas rosea]MBB6051055.1 prepilin-type N-terminal cleavage/methylation domain-containing protein/prepilin-type processing-associated H-X9-DG protein [Armatimonas rosea]
MKQKNAFTLIELLVVIAIIAILAAILFPVFAQARAKARQATCISNVKQIALSSMMYVQDYDEQFQPYQTVGLCPSTWAAQGACTANTNVTLGYLALLQPYSKSNLYSQCPEAKQNNKAAGTALRLWLEGRVGYGMAYPPPGENLGALATGSMLASMEAPAEHALLMDVVPDGANGLSIYNSFGGYYNHATTPFALTEYGSSAVLVPANHERPHGRHNGMVTVSFCDGHAKALPFTKVYPVQESVCGAPGSGTGCSTIATTAALQPEIWKLWK